MLHIIFCCEVVGKNREVSIKQVWQVLTSCHMLLSFVMYLDKKQKEAVVLIPRLHRFHWEPKKQHKHNIRWMSKDNRYACNTESSQMISTLDLDWEATGSVYSPEFCVMFLIIFLMF